MLVAILMQAVPTMVLADDVALYDAPLPDDAAFLRFIGFPEDAEFEVFGLSFSGDRVTSMHYNVIRASVVDGIETGQILTVVPNEDGSFAFIEEAERTPRKTTLQLVNLSALGPVSMTTDDGAVEIIAPTDRSKIGSRAVNPIRVTVVLGNADGDIGSPIEMSLRPNQHMTFVVMPDGGVEVVGNDVIPEAIP